MGLPEVEAVWQRLASPGVVVTRMAFVLRNGGVVMSWLWSSLSILRDREGVAVDQGGIRTYGPGRGAGTARPMGQLHSLPFTATLEGQQSRCSAYIATFGRATP